MNTTNGVPTIDVMYRARGYYPDGHNFEHTVRATVPAFEDGSINGNALDAVGLHGAIAAIFAAERATRGMPALAMTFLEVTPVGAPKPPPPKLAAVPE